MYTQVVEWRSGLCLHAQKLILSAHYKTQPYSTTL